MQNNSDDEQRIEALQKDIVIYLEQIRKLHNQLKDRENELNEAKKRIIKLINNNKNFEGQINHIENLHENNNKNFIAQELELKNAKEEIKKFKNLYNQLENSYELLQKEENSKHNEFDKKKLNLIIKKTKEEYKNALIEKDVLMHERDELQLRVNSLHDENNKYKIQTEMIKKCFASMNNNYKVLMNLINTHDKTIEDMRKEIYQKEVDFFNISDRYNELNEKYNDLKNNTINVESSNTLFDEFSQLKGNVFDSKKEVNKYNNYQNLIDENEELKRTINKITGENRKILEEVLSDMEIIRNKIR